MHLEEKSRLIPGLKAPICVAGLGGWNLFLTYNKVASADLSEVRNLLNAN